MMASCSNTDPKKNSASLVLGLFVVGIVYRIIFHAFPTHDFHKDLAGTATLETLTNDAYDSESECTEMECKLFTMWHAEAEAERLVFRDVENRLGFVGNRSLANGGHVRQTQEIHKDAQINDDAASLRSAPRGLRGSRNIMSTEQRLEKELAAKEKKVKDANERQAEFDRLYDVAEKAIHERPSSPGNKWLEIQAQLQSQYDSLPSTRARLARERRQEFDKIFTETEALMDAEKNTISPFARNLMNSQAELESKLEHLHDGHKPSSKFRGARVNATMDAKLGAKPSLDQLFADAEAMIHPKKKTVSPWAQSLIDTQADLQFKMDHLHDKLFAETETLVHPKKTWAQTLTDSQAEMQSKLDHLHDGHKQHSKLRGSRVVAKTGGTVDATASAPISLKWLPVKSWKEKAPRRDDGTKNTTTLKAFSVTREKLRHARWEDKIPNVSCIMAVPMNASAQYRFKYAINNFKLQHYEGNVELVVVYHHGDKTAARLVHTYAEEGRIRGVASRGAAEFPSTMALRYGAWTSKADVVAQWDFEAWHHPDRLSMQVRAMAMSGRPGSLVMDPEPHAKATEDAHIDVMEGSLTGDAAWMREHWHPLLEEERGLMETYQSHNMALVDAPALAIDHHHTLAMHTTSSPSSFPASVDGIGGHDALESIGIEACRKLITLNAPTNLSAESTSSVEVVSDGSLSKATRNVFDKLKTLCKEADDKVDSKERSFLHHHAGTMETFRKQLDAYGSRQEI